LFGENIPWHIFRGGTGKLLKEKREWTRGAPKLLAATLISKGRKNKGGKRLLLALGKRKKKGLAGTIQRGEFQGKKGF